MKISDMMRVPKEEFVRNTEKYFDIIDRDNVGIVITENNLDSKVVLPFDWFFDNKVILSEEEENRLFEQYEKLKDLSCSDDIPTEASEKMREIADEIQKIIGRYIG